MSRMATIHRHRIPVPAPVTDPLTGRLVYTLVPGEAETPYFRRTCDLADGRIIANGKQDNRAALYLLEPGADSVEVLHIDPFLRILRVRASDGMLLGTIGREIVGLDVMTGEMTVFGELPAELPGVCEDVAVDGSVAFVNDMNNSRHSLQPPTSMDPADLWCWIDRPRNGSLVAYDLRHGTVTPLYVSADHFANHVDACPGDPTLLRFCTDRCEAKAQRTYTVRTDGSELRPMRLQALGEVITHEFWWADAHSVGYTYQDRRGDTTLERLPWCEYSPVPTRLGIANAAGEEIYLSDPLDTYHQHLACSPDGSLVMGDGNEGNCFVAVSPFALTETQISFTKLASISTPYVPFRGQRVNGHITRDNRWVVYNEEVGDKMHIRAVAIDL